MLRYVLSEAIEPGNLVFLAGLLHFMQIPAVLVAPKMLNWKEELGRLLPINRLIFQMIGLGIMLMTLGAGIVVMVASDEVAGGGKLGTALCGYLAAVWLFRLLVQLKVYAPLWPGGLWGRLSHYGVVANLTTKIGIYFYVFLLGLARLLLGTP
jgi:hypothetical protein